jgi:hypothetical protein
MESDEEATKRSGIAAVNAAIRQKEEGICVSHKKYLSVFLTTGRYVPFGTSKTPSGGFRS